LKNYFFNTWTSTQWIFLCIFRICV